MPAQLEEVVGRADLRHAEQLAPDLGQLQLQGPARAHDRARVTHRARRGQGATIELARRSHRQHVEQHEGRRHERRGQAAFREVAQVGRRRRHAAPGDDVRHEPNVVGALAVGRDDRHLAHGRMRAQDGLHLGRLHAHAADLHLRVQATEILQRAVGPPPREIAAAIETRVGPGLEGMGDEALGREVGTIDVAARETGAPDVQFARDADRHRFAVATEHIDFGARDRSADRDRRRVRRERRRHRVTHGECRRLRRPIPVDEPRLRYERRRARDVGGRHRFAADEDLTQAPERVGRLVDHRVEERRGEQHRRDAMRADGVTQRRRRRNAAWEHYAARSM